MSRILVIGMGVPSIVASERHAGPGLRSAHFARALERSGHEVLLLAVQGEHDAAREPAGAGERLRIEFVKEADFTSAALRARVAQFAPDAVVGATVYAASLATRLRPDVPLWADVFGDLMAEAQAKAARADSDWSLVHFWTLLRPVLERADRFSAVSGAQAHALVGQLGLAGRLSARTAGEELVATIPCAADTAPRDADRAGERACLGIADDAFVLLASGGVNTWCDVATLCRGVELAMERDPRLHLLVTGGSIPGHDETSQREMMDAVASLPASRVTVLGWTSSTRLPGVYAASDLGLHVELPLYERMLGAENRVVEWLAHGVPCVTTAASESGAAMVSAGLSLRCRGGDADDLARTILEAARRPKLLGAMREEGLRWVAEERSFERAAAPLLAWCADPLFAKDRDGARLLRLGLVSHPATSAEMLEEYVAGLSVREILRRGLRWLARRTAAAASRAIRRPVRQPAPARSPDRASRHLAVLLVVSSLFAGGCDGRVDSRTGGRPNVLLLTIDTLRHDYVGAYGYGVKPSPTPWIDDLAARGTLYEAAVASAPETAPALATLLTGVYQDRHGVLFNRGDLREEQQTIAERLKLAGYATAAFVGNWLADPKHGFAQGFDRYEVIPAGTTIDDRVVAATTDFLRTADAKPWFVWAHLMDPHGPYNSAPPWWSKKLDFSNEPFEGDREVEVSERNFGLGVIPRYQRIEGLTRLSEYVRRYVGDIRYSDSQVGALLGAIAALGFRDDTIVVFAADHGESLAEHEELLQHGWFVYDTTARVPLVVAWPAGLPGGRRVAEQVCGVDVVPTVLDLAGVAADGADFDGRSFAEAGGNGAVSKLPDDAAALRDAGCFVIGPRFNRVLALRRKNYKLILTPAGTTRDPRAPRFVATDEPERLELYDLEADPGELQDLAASKPEVVEEMRQSVTSLRSRFRANGWRW